MIKSLNLKNKYFQTKIFYKLQLITKKNYKLKYFISFLNIFYDFKFIQKQFFRGKFAVVILLGGM